MAELDPWKTYLFATTEPGDDRSRQYRHAMGTGLATPSSMTGLDGEDRVVWGRVIECRPKDFMGQKLEEWVMEVVREV